MVIHNFLLMKNNAVRFGKIFATTEANSILFSPELSFADSCCEMTDCQKLKDKEAQHFTKDGNALVKSSCPPCEPKICYGKINQCPLHTGKFLMSH